jgi:hypothetical protein
VSLHSTKNRYVEISTSKKPQSELKMLNDLGYHLFSQNLEHVSTAKSATTKSQVQQMLLIVNWLHGLTGSTKASAISQLLVVLPKECSKLTELHKL